MLIRFLKTSGTISAALLCSACIVIAVLLLITIPFSRVETPYIRDSFLTISARNGIDLWNTWEESLDTDQSLQLESIVTTWARNMFGTEISVLYDVLPLSTGKTLLTLRRSDTGTAVMASVANKRATHRATIEKLHVAAASTLSPIKQTVRQLDERFTSTDLRIDALVTQSRTLNLSGWNVVITGPQEQPVLITATKGSTLVLTNDITLISEWTAGSYTWHQIGLEPLTGNHSRLATLIYDPEPLNRFLSSTVPFIEGPKPGTKLLQIGSILIEEPALRLETKSVDIP